MIWPSFSLSSSLKDFIGLLCHISPAYNPFGSALSNLLMELESALFCFYWIKTGRKMDSVHMLWALLKIGPPQWELCHTWLLCLSPAGLRIGLAMCFCLSSLFCLVVLWISIWFFISLLHWKSLYHFWIWQPAEWKSILKAKSGSKFDGFRE